MNMLTNSASEKISELLDTIGKPARLNILAAIGLDEACVCHLEAELGLRQAYISQNLMALRSAGLLETRRDGKYIYYSLTDKRILELIEGAAAIKGIALKRLKSADPSPGSTTCGCPKCTAGTVPALVQVD
jgi:ArsR family transcriptional regulator